MLATNSFISAFDLNTSAASAIPSIPSPPPVRSDDGVQVPRSKITNEGSTTEIIQRVLTLTDNWPRSVAQTLFVDDPVNGIHYFDKNGPARLFGWLRSRLNVEWRTGAEKATQAELFAELERTASRYDAVELLPHEPLINGVYYRGEVPKAGDGKYLREMLDRFNPETDIDRDLIQAAFMTPFWGGPPGPRPAFVITSDAGRGAGKSTIPELVSYLSGGHIDVSAGGEIEQIKTRMLTKATRTKRIAIIDNVKSLKFSWAEFEAAITSPVISGHEMYLGEGQRPNLITWFITLNGIAMATDLAQRSVIIKINKAIYAGGWLEETYRFIDMYRDQIIGDIIAALRAEPYELESYSRWATWEKGVLSRLPEPSEAQRVILERQAAANVELDEAEIIEDFFAAELDRLGYDSEASRVRIPVSRAAEWFKKATGDSRIGTTSASKRLRQMIGESQLKKLEEDPSRTYGRCFIWTPSLDMVFDSPESDLEKRVGQYYSLR